MYLGRHVRGTVIALTPAVIDFQTPLFKCSRDPKDDPSSSQFTGEVMANLNNCLELSTKELDLVILTNIQVLTRFENIGE